MIDRWYVTDFNRVLGVPDGEYVLYSDHADEIAKARKIISAIKPAQYTGCVANDIDGKNWFDAAEQWLKDNEEVQG